MILNLFSLFMDNVYLDDARIKDSDQEHDIKRAIFENWNEGRGYFNIHNSLSNADYEIQEQLKELKEKETHSASIWQDKEANLWIKAFNKYITSEITQKYINTYFEIMPDKED